jgi:hypothetical protein
MPIVTNSLQSTTQADGGTNNVLRMYDQDGIEYLQSFYAPAGFNLQTKVDNTISGLNEQLATSEFQSLIGL